MELGYWALFWASLLASTLVPGGVEVPLYFMVNQAAYPSLMLLVVAGLGNTLGGWLTFAMGRALRQGAKRWNWRWSRWLQGRFKLQPNAEQRVKQWGVWALLFSWLPIVGDPIALAGGYASLSMLPSLLAIAVGKFLRYTVLLMLFGWQ